MKYSDLEIGTKVYNAQMDEHAMIEARHPNGYLMLRLLDGPDKDDTIDMSPSEVATFWRVAP